MEMRVYLASSLILYLVIPVLGQDLQLLTVPQPTLIIDGETTSLQVRCSFTGTSNDVTLQNIRLNFQKPSSAGPTELAQVQGKSATITDPDLTSRASVTGEISLTTTSSFLHLQITENVTCAEVGNYTCITSYGGTEKETEATVTGRSHPSELEVRHEPLKTRYSVGEEVTIICSGKVGKPAQDWSWQKYDEEKKSWTVYTSDVTQEPPSIVSDCAFFRIGRLRFRIPDDKEHTFRCIVGPNVDKSVETTINGQVGGASVLLISPILLFCSLIFTSWK